MKRKFVIVAVLLTAALGLLAASGVVSSTKNPLQVAILHWYAVNEVPTQFTAQGYPFGLAFDGASIWVTNAAATTSNTAQKFRASDGLLQGTFPTGKQPLGN